MLMNKKEKEIFCNKIFKVEKLLEEYEAYVTRSHKKLLRHNTCLRVFCGGGLLVAFGLCCFAVFNLILGGLMSIEGFIISLIAIFIAIGVFVTVVAFSAFHINSRDVFISDDEYSIYKNNKGTFAFFKEINFPLDYMCSGFAKAVRNEIEKGSSNEIDDIYIKCRSVNFDIANDATADYINANRDFVVKIRRYMGII